MPFLETPHETEVSTFSCYDTIWSCIETKRVFYVVCKHVIFVFDTNKPDGQLTRIVNCDFIKQLGWKPKTTLKEGVKNTVEWFLQNPSEIM